MNEDVTKLMKRQARLVLFTALGCLLFLGLLLAGLFVLLWKVVT